MKKIIECNNICCIFECDGCCRAPKISLDERGICQSCYLLPVDIADLNRRKELVNWESDSVYQVEKRNKK